MSEISIVFCGKCNSLLVDSGYETHSTLKCCNCGNEKELKVGKVAISPNASVSLEEIMIQAKKEAQIY